MGQGRAIRTKGDPATKIAKKAQAEWGSPAKYPRQQSPRLSLEKIILTAIPFIEELAGKKIRGVTPKSERSIEMEPPEFGALVALARMHKRGASFEYVCDILAKHDAQTVEKKQ